MALEYFFHYIFNCFNLHAPAVCEEDMQIVFKNVKYDQYIFRNLELNKYLLFISIKGAQFHFTDQSFQLRWKIISK